MVRHATDRTGGFTRSYRPCFTPCNSPKYPCNMLITPSFVPLDCGLLYGLGRPINQNGLRPFKLLTENSDNRMLSLRVKVAAPSFSPSKEKRWVGGSNYGKVCLIDLKSSGTFLLLITSLIS